MVPTDGGPVASSEEQVAAALRGSKPAGGVFIATRSLLLAQPSGRSYCLVRSAETDIWQRIFWNKNWYLLVKKFREDGRRALRLIIM